MRIHSSKSTFTSTTKTDSQIVLGRNNNKSILILRPKITQKKRKEKTIYFENFRNFFKLFLFRRQKKMILFFFSIRLIRIIKHINTKNKNKNSEMHIISPKIFA